MIPLVGVHGFKRSGKDTFARYLEYISNLYSEHYSVSKVTHYADPMKKALAKLYGLPLRVLYDDLYKEDPKYGVNGKSPRELMTDAHDILVPIFGEDLFVNAIRKEYESFPDNGLFIIADVRYAGREDDWIRDLGGLVVHIVRPGIGPSEHSSEKGIPVHPGDLVVPNDAGREELMMKAVFTYQYLVGGPKPAFI